jgi:hypothetical protein
MSVVQAVYDAIIADTTFTGKLATYRNNPAVFSVDPPPEQSASPSVVMAQVGSVIKADDRGTRAGEYVVDVKLWGDREDSEKVLRDLADELWLLLNRASVSADGFDETVYCLADPPTRLTDPDGFPGFLVSCRVLVRTE